MPGKKKYQVALVGGAGTWGRHYLRAYAEHPNCEIIALADRARDRRQAFSERYGIEQVCDTVEEILARQVPDIVSAVIPVAHNPEVVITCARAGVRVISCEKPIAAELARADEMVRVCQEHGAIFCCGSVYSGVPYLTETLEWVRQGHLGQLEAAAIPSGLPHEVSGGSCVQLSLLRLITNMEVEWAEGWTLPPRPGNQAPEAEQDTEVDCPAYGRLGLSNGVVCEIPPPGRGGCFLALTGEQGQMWLASPRPVFVQGKGPESTPVFPDFLASPPPADFFTRRIEWLMRAFDTGGEVVDSGRGYHQALEIAIALIQSAHRDHERIHLPLEDRALKLFPHPYRLHGGDVAGWETIGYQGPPSIE